MPEIGLLPFARVAMDIATAILPTYRSRFSKHQFTQPQLLAILCLMRYEDWTFREAEVRLREHAELRCRAATCPACPTTPPCIASCGGCRTIPWRARWENRCGDYAAVRAAADAGHAWRWTVPGLRSTLSALISYAASSSMRAERRTIRHFLKWLIVVDVDRQIILAQRARQGPWCDTRALPGLVDAASRTMPIGVVLADAEFDSEANHRHVRGTLGAHSVIPPNRRRGIPEGEFRYQMHRAFPRPLYGPRAKIETVFSVIKRKLSSKAPGRSLPIPDAASSVARPGF